MWNKNMSLLATIVEQDMLVSQLGGVGVSRFWLWPLRRYEIDLSGVKSVEYDKQTSEKVAIH